MSGHPRSTTDPLRTTTAATSKSPSGPRKRHRPVDDDQDHGMLDHGPIAGVAGPADAGPVNSAPVHNGAYDDAMAEEQDHVNHTTDDDTSDDGVEYLETQEALPAAAAYDKDFAQALEDTRKLLREVGAVIQEEQQGSPRFKQLTQELMRSSHPTEPRKRRINVVGRSGSGKSSLINSVLDRPHAAKALSMGGGCTHVPTTYRCRFHGQKKQFAAATIFFTPERIRQMLEMLLEAYFFATFKDLSDEEDMEIVKIKTAAATSIDTFRTLFCDRAEFSSEEAGKRFLRAAFDMDRKLVVGTLLEWSKSLIERAKKDRSHASVDSPEGHDFVEIDSQRELYKYMETFGFSDSDFRTPRLWPLVDRILQGLSDVRVLDYCELTDFPGEGDTNKLRGSASVDRIYQNVDEIWLVSSIDRVATDEALVLNLTRYANRIDCTLVCTGADTNLLDYGLGKDLQAKGVAVGFEKLWKEEMGLRAETQKLRKKVEKIEKTLMRSSTGSSVSKRPRLSERAANDLENEHSTAKEAQDAGERRLDDAIQKRFLLMYWSRQDHIRDKIRKEFARHVPSADRMKVFFVSNTHYIAIKTGDKVPGPALLEEDTGIRGIRAWIYECAAPGIFKAAKQFVEHDVAGILNGLKILANPKDEALLHKAIASVDGRMIRLDSLADHYRKKAAQVVGDDLLRPLAQDQGRFRNHAIAVLKQKSKWNHQPIKAFVRNNGTWQTSTKPWHSWNEEFAKTFTDVLKNLWTEFLKHEDAAFQDLQTAIVQECKGIVEELHHGDMQYGLEQESFEDFIDGQASGIAQLCQSTRDDLSRELMWVHSVPNSGAHADYCSTVEIEATQQIDNGHFGSAMKKAYTDAGGISGTFIFAAT